MTSISMPSMTAMKSSRRRSNARTACGQSEQRLRRRAGDRARRCRRATAAAASRRDLARARIVGDVVDRAAERIDLEHRLALCARQDPHRRYRTSCRRRARPPVWAWSLTHPAASATRRRQRRPSRRDAPLRMPIIVKPATPGTPRCTRSLSGSRAMSMRVRRCASVLMTETSRPRRQSLIRAGKISLSLSNRPVRSASRCRQASSAGEARGSPSASTLAPRSRRARRAEHRPDRDSR